MLVDIVVGLLIGYSVLAAVLVLALPRDGRRAAPQDRAAAGSVVGAPTLVAVLPGPDRARSGVGEVQVDDVPTGAAMRPLDVWDAVAAALVLGLVLTVPVVGGVVAALLIPLLVVAPLLVLRLVRAGHLLDRGGGPSSGGER